MYVNATAPENPLNIAAQVLGNPPKEAPPATTPQTQDKTSQTPPPAADNQDQAKRISGQISAMLQREKRNLEIEARNKAKEQELAERVKKLEEFEALKSNPLKALEALGLDYNAITKAQLADGQIPPEVEIKKLDQKLDSFLEAQKQQEQQREQLEKKRQEEENNRLISEFKTEITDYVKEHSERYEFITFENAQELVYAVIDEHYERTRNPESGKGEVLTISQAADKVEEYLEKKYLKAKELKKLQALLQPVAVSKQPVKTNPVNSQKPKTLTNQASASPEPIPAGILSDDERVRRAIAYARGLRT